MFRRSLAGDRGMIFPYDPPQEVAFWMKNTLIPLDIIYIRADGTIARIVNAEALDLTPLPSGEPIAVVLEIRGGRASELGIREGDKVSWAKLAPALHDAAATGHRRRPMGFWSKTFTWWNGATVGTALFTRRFGDEVGRDDEGNIYYQDKKQPRRRWVIYDGNNDGSRVPPSGSCGFAGPLPTCLKRRCRRSASSSRSRLRT